MSAVQKIGIVGAGVAGTAAAIFLAEAGFAVEILERRDGPSGLGSGITLQGNGLRVLRQLGVWEDIEPRGFAFSSLGLRAPDPEATVLAVVDDIRTGGDDLPATLGMYRPELAAIMAKRAEDAGAVLSYGLSVEAVEQDPDGVDVTLSNGTSRRFELLIGADGLHSSVRRLMGIDLEPGLVGMGIWRAFVPRPADVVRTDLIYGGPCHIAGYCPTGDGMMYAYLVEDAQHREEADGPRIMSELAAAYGGPWRAIRESLSGGASGSRVNYTQFTSHLVDGPWHRGRVVLIGDAAHSCPPTIAQGAAMALEDAAVLAELLTKSRDLGEEALAAFTGRRLPRAKATVEASTQLATWLLEHNRNADVPGLLGRISHMVKEPA